MTDINRMVEEDNYRIENPKDEAGLPSEKDEHGERIDSRDAILDMTADEVEAELLKEF
ncbi:MAG: hypothetical protein NVSMB14_01450 [Isosphaeraceae bacterium]